MSYSQSGEGQTENATSFSPLEAVGHLDAMDGTNKQRSLVSDNQYADLDINVDDLRAKLTTTFLELLDNKHTNKFCVALHVCYTHPTMDLGNSDSIVLNS